MTREIKFRAWYEYNKEMRNWDRIKNSPMQVIQYASKIKFMQFTGITDKKGVDVYEGDLIKWIDHLGREFIHPVSWETKKCMFILESENFSLGIYKGYKIFEVVGNIYENPELLTK